jgi:hypothetical protein
MEISSNLNFWGDPKLSLVLNQVKNTMLVTMWVFIGIECESVYLTRAHKLPDVGRATVEVISLQSSSIRGENVGKFYST